MLDQDEDLPTHERIPDERASQKPDTPPAPRRRSAERLRFAERHRRSSSPKTPSSGQHPSSSCPPPRASTLDQSLAAALIPRLVLLHRECKLAPPAVVGPALHGTAACVQVVVAQLRYGSMLALARARHLHYPLPSEHKDCKLAPPTVAGLALHGTTTYAIGSRGTAALRLYARSRQSTTSTLFRSLRSTRAASWRHPQWLA